MSAETLSIRLPIELANLLREPVANGSYSSGSEVIEDALRLWRQRADEISSIRTSLEEAANDSSPLSHLEMRAHFEARAAELLAQSRE